MDREVDGGTVVPGAGDPFTMMEATTQPGPRRPLVQKPPWQGASNLDVASLQLRPRPFWTVPRKRGQKMLRLLVVEDEHRFDRWINLPDVRANDHEQRGVGASRLTHRLAVDRLHSKVRRLYRRIVEPVVFVAPDARGTAVAGDLKVARDDRTHVCAVVHDPT